KDRHMRKAEKTYTVHLIGSMIAYGLVLVASILILKASTDEWWRVPVALAPVVPAIFGLLAFVRFLGRIDELERRIQLEAIGFGFGGTAVLTFGYGFLENAGFPHLNWVYVFPIMIFLWGIGLAIARRKYT
ncbi:MAG TPA: hypothetical protein VEX13_17885, partial [Chloroflexia bacterium]|nr:hypothetical protein [Chloroflexia bacterium]